MFILEKHKKLFIFLICLAVFFIVLYITCFDLPCNMHYTVAASTTKPDVLEISLEVTNPLFSKGKEISLYTGDKAVTLKSCIDKNGLRTPVQQTDHSIDIYLGRGKKTILAYEAQIGKLGKHGLRGSTSEDYCVFDGGEAFLLPMEYYETACPESEAVIGELSITVKKKDGWTEAIPYTDIKNVTWADAYDLNNNSFCMGLFSSHNIRLNSDSLKIYTLSQSKEALTDSVQNGILALYRYYAGLFPSSPKNYSIILLPSAEEAGFSVIGGAGTGSVCAAFNANNKRDWELLSHRMFHAYFDSIFRTKEFHSAPRLWFYEGIATYYENRSMGFLPKELQTALGIRPEQQFTSLFNRYLYVRLKDPALFSLVPMDEEKIRKSEAGDAKIEFLHYVQAPLVIRLMEEISYRKTQKSDFLLKYLLENKSSPDRRTYAQLLSGIPGNQKEEIYQNYFVADHILPLWFLRDNTYSQEQTLSDLNDIEYQLASWIPAQSEKYPPEELNMKTVQKIQNSTAFQSVLFSDRQTEQSVRNYSATVYSLLKEHALRADICNVSLDDPELHYKLSGEKNKAKWTAWVENAASGKP